MRKFERIGREYAVHTVYEEEDAYVATYFVPFLRASGCVVDRASGDADDNRFGDAGEGSGEEVESSESTSIKDTDGGLRLGLRLRLTN